MIINIKAVLKKYIYVILFFIFTFLILLKGIDKTLMAYGTTKNERFLTK
jgi:hypothetical protein